MMFFSRQLQILAMIAFDVLVVRNVPPLRRVFA